MQLRDVKVTIFANTNVAKGSCGTTPKAYSSIGIFDGFEQTGFILEQDKMTFRGIDPVSMSVSRCTTTIYRRTRQNALEQLIWWKGMKKSTV